MTCTDQWLTSESATVLNGLARLFCNRSKSERQSIGKGGEYFITRLQSFRFFATKNPEVYCCFRGASLAPGLHFYCNSPVVSGIGLRAFLGGAQGTRRLK